MKNIESQEDHEYGAECCRTIAIGICRWRFCKIGSFLEYWRIPF